MNNRRRGWFKSKQNTATPFVSTWRTTNTSTGSSANNQVRLPLISTGTYNFVVNWGDGNEDTITVWNQAETTHTYASTGDYTITITGIITGWRFANTGDRLKILTISQWGLFSLQSETNSINGHFYGCSNLNVTATDAPTILGGLAGLFRACSALVGNSSFNTWDTSLCNNLSGTFNGCTLFNQNINNWNVSSVTSISTCFQACTNFNQPLNLWNVSSVTLMQIAFFQATNFNQDISSWNVSSVTNFQQMFQQATNFNQNISSWNVSSATNMREMFNTASAFNQNIGSWNVSSVTNFILFMTNKTAANFSTTNLDAIYNGWTNRALATGIATSFGTIKYTAGATSARALLTRANSTVTVTNAVNNGSGLIRITTGAAHGRTTGDKIFISGVTGTTEANGGWIVTVIDATTVDLQASTFTNTYVSGGTFRIGYGWTITDGGL